jgi:enoyl-CoA hydratase/carnithine racemase
MIKEVFANGHLELMLEGSIARLVLNRPDKRHALTQAMWEALPVALAMADESAEVKVIILESSSTNAFCAGADIEEFSRFAQDRQWRQANQLAISQTQVQLARARKPTIAKIQGVCVGGGCGLALACDFRISDTTARLGITPSKLGLVYSLHDTKLLVDLVGLANAKMVLFTGKLFSAGAALEMGLLSVVVGPEELVTTVNNLAGDISQNSQHSIRNTKQIIRQIMDGTTQDTEVLSQLFFDAFDGEDYREGVSAFIEKRKPVFPFR